MLSRLDRLEAWRGPLKLVPYALLLVGAILAGAAAVLGSVSAERPGAREVASIALAILCLTPLIGASAVRLRYGVPGKRTFQQQIAANRGSSVLLVAVLFEIMAVTGFLIGAAVGVAFGAALAAGLAVAADTVAALALWLVVVVVGLIVGGLLRLLAPVAALAVQAAVSRDREYLADATAIGITRNTAGLIGALEKLERTRADMKNPNRGTQHLWIVNPVKEGKEGGRGWFDTHPATSDRIERLQALTGHDVSDDTPQDESAT